MQPTQCAPPEKGSSWLTTLGYVALGGVLVVGATAGGLAYLGYSLYQQVLEKSPLTDAEIQELRDTFLAGMAEKMRKDDPLATDEEIKEALGDVDSIMWMFRGVFGALQLGAEGDGFISKEQLFTDEMTEREKGIADHVWRACDENQDGRISTKEFILIFMSALAPRDKQLEMSFKALDDDGDGELSREEVAYWLDYSLGRALRFKRNTSDEPSDDETRFIECNAAAVSEFEAAMEGVKAPFYAYVASNEYRSLEGEVKAAKFDELKQEVANAVRAERMKITSKMVDAIFAKYDTNKDGKLQKEEFMKIADGTMPMFSFTNTHFSDECNKNTSHEFDG